MDEVARLAVGGGQGSRLLCFIKLCVSALAATRVQRDAARPGRSTGRLAPARMLPPSRPLFPSSHACAPRPHRLTGWMLMTSQSPSLASSSQSPARSPCRPTSQVSGSAVTACCSAGRPAGGNGAQQRAGELQIEGQQQEELQAVLLLGGCAAGILPSAQCVTAESRHALRAGTPQVSSAAVQCRSNRRELGCCSRG